MRRVPMRLDGLFARRSKCFAAYEFAAHEKRTT
jgi:hypothetical protein